jgi:hypothetical protein
MIEFDVLVETDAQPRSGNVPRIASYRVTDVTAVVGAFVWLALAGLWTMRDAHLLVELYIALAVLVLVPLGLGLARTPRRSGGTSLLYRIVVLGQFPCALAAVAGLTAPVGSTERLLLLLPWAVLTTVVGLFGAWRFFSGGFVSLPELSIDAALLYVPVAGVFLIFHATETFFHFEPQIVLLTSIHFHYAGFVLPLVTGLIGRSVAGADGTFDDTTMGWLARASTVGMIVGISTIAIAITVSPWLELQFPAVLLFTLSVVAIAAVMLSELVPTLPRGPGLLLTIAAASIVITLGLALAYAYSEFSWTGELIGIHRMVHWHGTINALGFSLSALVAFRWLDS